jgi:biotin carboxylase
MKPFFLLVESNTSGTGRLFAGAARALGCSPVMLASDPSRYPYLQEDGVRSVVVNTLCGASVLQAAAMLEQERPVRGILTSSGYFTVIASQTASALGCPAANPQALALAGDKAAQYEVLRMAGIPVPRFETIRKAGDLDRVRQQMRYPVVVKPAMGTGSVDVRKFSDSDAATRHVHCLLAKTVNERDMQIEPAAILMQYVSGQEYSVEIFCRTVIGITKKHLSAEPFFVETGHDYPAVLSDGDRLQIERCALAATDALGLDWGPIHVELRMSNKGPMLIEVNARLAGGYIPEIVCQATGVDLVASTVKLAMGDAVDTLPRKASAASIRFINATRDGTLEGVSGMEEAQAMAGIVNLNIYKKPGSRVRLYGDFRDRVGHVIATGATTELAAARAQRAHSHLAAIIHA